MMVLIDTSVWIDFFSARPLPHVSAMESIIEQRKDICICGIIVTEILQGIRNETEFKKDKRVAQYPNLSPNAIFYFFTICADLSRAQKKGADSTETFRLYDRFSGN
jgi:predicted nucleic acid-binding protein